MRKYFWLVLTLFLLPNTWVLAQELHNDVQGLWRAEVVRVVREEEVLVPGTDTTHIYQTLEVTPLEGEREGELIVFDNDFIQLKEGDKFFLYYLVDISGAEMYSVRDVDRRPVMLWFLGLFILATILLGGMQGIKALLAPSSSSSTFWYQAYLLATLPSSPPQLSPHLS